MSQMSESQDVEDNALNVRDADSDWEYEYDDTETESFFVTIDISSTSHQTPGPPKSVPFQEANPAPTQNEQPQEGEDTPANQETPTIDPSLTNTPLVPNLSTAGHMHPHDRIQILDLHTQNPLISYRNRVYTCAWSSTLGTDIFLTRPSTSLPQSITSLLSLPNVSIIGTSCINLTARAATVVPKADKAPPQQPPPTTTSTNPNPNPSTQPIKIPLADSAPSSRHKQAAFLESLMALKAAKGERDQVTVYAVKSSQGTGWRTRKRLEQELLENLGPPDDGGNNQGDASSTAGATTEREAKRARRGIGSGGRRRLGRPRGSSSSRARRGSRFADVMERELIFAAAANEEVGGGDDDGKGADKTPVRWEDVEGGY